MLKFVIFLWKFAVGTVLCLTPLSAILVIGWTARAMRRRSALAWYRHSGRHTASTPFRTFAATRTAHAHLAAWPNWILGQAPGAMRAAAAAQGLGARAVPGLWLRILAGSLWENFRTGLQVLLNTWTLTLPAGALWLMSWWGGWENSFNKGYEQAFVGPGVALAGIAMFVTALFHVPLAQARQASGGQWRVFYGFAFVRALRRHGRFGIAKLALRYVVAGAVLAALHAAPLALGGYLDGQEELSAQQRTNIAALYHLITAAAVFAMFVWLRLAAAILYGEAVLRALHARAITRSDLSALEQGLLEDLDIDTSLDETRPNAVIRAVQVSGRSIAALTLTAAIAALWFALAAETYIAQFLNHRWLSWINHAFVQIPWLG